MILNPPNTQIKYLRVPDTLLDAVKDEQNRAREAGRSTRGGGGGGGMGRGGALSFLLLHAIRRLIIGCG